MNATALVEVEYPRVPANVITQRRGFNCLRGCEDDCFRFQDGYSVTWANVCRNRFRRTKWQGDKRLKTEYTEPFGSLTCMWMLEAREANDFERNYECIAKYRHKFKINQSRLVFPNAFSQKGPPIVFLRAISRSSIKIHNLSATFCFNQCSSERLHILLPPPPFSGEVYHYVFDLIPE